MGFAEGVHAGAAAFAPVGRAVDRIFDRQLVARQSAFQNRIASERLGLARERLAMEKQREEHTTKLLDDLLSQRDDIDARLAAEEMKADPVGVALRTLKEARSVDRALQHAAIPTSAALGASLIPRAAGPSQPLPPGIEGLQNPLAGVLPPRVEDVTSAVEQVLSAHAAQAALPPLYRNPSSGGLSALARAADAQGVRNTVQRGLFGRGLAYDTARGLLDGSVRLETLTESSAERALRLIDEALDLEARGVFPGGALELLGFESLPALSPEPRSAESLLRRPNGVRINF